MRMYREDLRMNTRTLRDSSGHLIGRLQTRPDGTVELRDERNRLKGTYDPKLDQTRDPAGNLVGRGDLLTSLL